MCGQHWGLTPWNIAELLGLVYSFYRYFIGSDPRIPYPSIKHKQKWVWGDRPWKHFPSAGRKTCIWKVSVYSQLGDRHRNIVPVGLLLEQGTPWTRLSGAVKGGHHQYCKSTWSTQLICNIVNETDNPAGNLPDCTKMPMTQNLADLWHGSKSD